MKRPSFLPRFILFVLSGMALPTPGSAQNSPPAPPAAEPAAEPAGLEQMPAKLAQLEKSLAASRAAARATVAAELAAKRINEATASQLGFSLRASESGSPAGSLALLQSARLPPDNAALVKAFNELTEEITRAQARREELQAAGRKEIQKRLGQAVRSATQVSEVSALMAALDGLRITGPRQNGDLRDFLSGAISVLTNLKVLLEAQARGDVASIAAALGTLRQSTTFDRDTFTDGQMQVRVDLVMTPFSKAVEEAQDALDAALRGGKPASESIALLGPFAGATERLATMRGTERSGLGSESRNAPEAYRALIGVLLAMEAGNEMLLETRLQDARQDLRNLDARRAAPYGVLLAQWQQEASERYLKKLAEETAGLRARFAAVAKPEDLAALASEVAVLNSSQRGRSDRDSQDFLQLANQLNALATAWTWADPAIFAAQRSLESLGIRSAFSQEFTQLRRRVERDIVSRALRAPELLTPPLSELDPAAALDRLCDELAAKAEWRRLCQILETRASMDAASGRRSEDTALGALRAYFSGQNFELAEQWGDAAAAYKLVLRSVSPRAPISPAAERLKAFKKEHPEALAAPAAAPAPGLEARPVYRGS